MSKNPKYFNIKDMYVCKERLYEYFSNKQEQMTVNI